MTASGYPSWRRLRHRLRRLGQVSPREHALLAEASIRLLAAKIAVKTVPFKRLAPRIGELLPPPQAGEKAAHYPPSAADMAIAREIGWAVTRAAQHLPFEAVCLPQAIAAHAMLRRRGIFSLIHFGTTRGDASPLGFAAHAWLNAGEVEVTGYPVGAEFVEIACIA